MEDVGLVGKFIIGFIFSAPFFAMIVMPIAAVFLIIENRKRKPLNYQRTEKVLIFGLSITLIVLYMIFS